MSMWSRDELRKIAEADDLHISPFRDDGVTVRHPDVDLVRRGRRRPLCARLQRAEFPLVSGRGATDSRTDNRLRDDQGGHLRGGGRTDQQSHRRRLPGEVP
jgi:hypothetical protein